MSFSSYLAPTAIIPPVIQSQYVRDDHPLAVYVFLVTYPYLSHLQSEFIALQNFVCLPQ